MAYISLCVSCHYDGGSPRLYIYGECAEVASLAACLSLSRHFSARNYRGSGFAPKCGAREYFTGQLFYTVFAARHIMSSRRSHLVDCRLAASLAIGWRQDRDMRDGADGDMPMRAPPTSRPRLAVDLPRWPRPAIDISKKADDHGPALSCLPSRAFDDWRATVSTRQFSNATRLSFNKFSPSVSCRLSAHCRYNAISFRRRAIFECKGRRRHSSYAIT